MNATLTILGSGTSHGVPMIGCDCRTCTSEDPRDRRGNASALLRHGKQQILIDCGRDFRTQALTHRLKRLDAVVLTHNHHDHVAGIDDLRVFTGRKRPPLPVYGKKDTLDYLKEHTYRYLFRGGDEKAGGLAELTLNAIDGPFEVGGVRFEPLPVLHGRAEILGYRFVDCAYISDVSSIPDSTMDRLDGLDVLILDALRHRPHPTHLSVEQALEVIRALRPRRAFLTHMCHDVLHTELEERLRGDADHSGIRVSPAYDGMALELGGLQSARPDSISEARSHRAMS